MGRLGFGVGYVTSRLLGMLMLCGGPPRPGPAAGSGVQEETEALVGPIAPKVELLQIGKNKIISLLPYQGYTVTQRQVNRM